MLPAPRRLIATLLTAGVVAMWVVAGLSQGNPQSSNLDALFKRWSEGRTPGAAIAVIHNGRVVHAQGYGFANVERGDRITPNTVFDIASVSKQFTAMAIMMLIERGQLRSTDAISAFFPTFSSDAGRITVSQLLNHTSGIMDYTLAWGETRKRPGGAARTNRAVVEFLAGRKLRFAPGARWEYSNSNYVLLAEIVGRVSGKAFPAFARDEIFRPLEMTSTFVHDGVDSGTISSSAHAIGYTSAGKGFRPVDRNQENYVCGDGQVNSTLDDLVKWNQALDTERLVKKAMLQSALVPGRLNDGTPVSYAFGWGLASYGGSVVVSHGGETDGFVAQITRIPEHRFTVIVLSNDDRFTALHAIANKAADIYVDGTGTPPPSDAGRSSSSDYAGTFSLYDLVFNITADGNALALSTSGQPKVKLVRVAGDQFAIEGAGPAPRIAFVRNSQAQVTCLTLLDQNGTMLCRR